MKKAIVLILILFLCASACGCISSSGHYRTTMCISNQTTDSFSMEYESFDGEKTYSFQADADAVLSAEFTTSGGTLSCVVTDRSGNEYFRSDDVQTEKLTIRLGDKGKYFVSFKAKEHKGSFRFALQ